MKKHLYLGITPHGNACVLSSLAGFEELAADVENIEASDFQHGATNWAGHDEIESTLEKRRLERTGRGISLLNTIEFSGTDYDTGREYKWTVTVSRIEEVTEKDAPQVVKTEVNKVHIWVADYTNEGTAIGHCVTAEKVWADEEGEIVRILTEDGENIEIGWRKA